MFFNIFDRYLYDVIQGVDKFSGVVNIPPTTCLPNPRKNNPLTSRLHPWLYEFFFFFVNVGYLYFYIKINLIKKKCMYIFFLFFFFNGVYNILGARMMSWCVVVDPDILHCVWCIYKSVINLSQGRSHSFISSQVSFSLFYTVFIYLIYIYRCVCVRIILSFVFLCIILFCSFIVVL